MRVVAGPRSQRLAFRVSEELDAELVRADVSRFPDGEQSVRLRGDPGDRVAVVQSTRTDRDLVTMMLLVDAARRQGASVTAVAPYLGYARQDQVFEPGQPVSLAAVVRAVTAQGPDLVTVDPHTDPSDHGDVTSLSATPVLGEVVEPWGPDLVLAPDEGAKDRAAAVAEIVGADHDHLVKTRVSGDEVSVEPHSLSVDGRDAVIVDDVIATGGTMSETVSILKEQGASSISAAATHGVLAGSAVSRLLSAGVDRLAVTDTLETSFSEATVAPLIADGLRQKVTG